MKRASIFQNDSIRELLYQMFKTEGLPQSARVKGSQVRVYRYIIYITLNTVKYPKTVSTNMSDDD